MVWNTSKEHLKATGLLVSFWESFVSPSVLRIKGNKCELCGSGKRVCVHHKSYEEQTLENLQVLCFVCHNELHKKLYRLECKNVRSEK